MTLRHVRGHATGLGMILLIALAARLIWAAYVHPDPADGRFDDTVWYRGAAHYLAAGEGYLNPFSGTPTAAWPPGYPAFLAGVFKLFGEGVAQTVSANIAVSVVTVVLVYCIAVVVAERRVALIAAGAMAVWPGQVYFTSLTLSEPLFTMLFAGAVLAMLLAGRAHGRTPPPARPRQRRAEIAPARADELPAAMTDDAAMRGVTGGNGRPRFAMSLLVVAFGVAVALAALTRGQAMLLLPFAAVCFVMAGMRWRAAIGWTALATIVTLTALAPWAIRNARMLDSFVLISTNMGTNLWMGHSDAATGRMSIDGAHPPLTERGDRTQGEWEAANDRLALRKGLRWMVTHPIDEISLAGQKLRAMYESDATALDWNSAYERDTYYASPEVEDALRATANGFWFAAIGLAGIGVVAAAIGRPAGVSPVALTNGDSHTNALFWTMPALVLAWTAGHLLFFGDSRFHYPIVFAIAIVGGRGVVAVYDAARAQAPVFGRRYAEA